MGSLEIPCETICSVQHLNGIGQDHLNRLRALVHLLGATGEDNEFVLGERPCSFGADYCGYEDYVSGMIRDTMSYIWGAYWHPEHEGSARWDTEAIDEDLDILARSVIYAGKYPGLTPLRAFDSHRMSPGAGGLNTHFAERRCYYLQHKKYDVVQDMDRFSEQVSREWITIQFEQPHLGAAHELGRVLNHLNDHCRWRGSTRRVSVFDRCPTCRVAPRLLSTIDSGALGLSSEFFCHLAVPDC